MEYVSYIRVSTNQQEASGLGLEAQQTIINNFIKEGDIILKQFIEVESGKKSNNRPQLLQALNYCQQYGTTLLISKLDRLSRDASFILSLRDANIDFVCCDMPDANRFTIGIFALIAEQERQFISDRTKAALAELKRRGKKLGNPQNLTQSAREKGVKVRKEKANSNQNNIRARAMVKTLLEKDFFMSLKAIADALNANGFKTARGKAYFPATVKRIVDSLKE